MKKMRILARDVDPETGDIHYFRAGHTSRMEAIKGERKQRPPSKGWKAKKRREKKQRYENAHPRPLFHTPVEEPPPAVRRWLKKQVFRRDKRQCQACGSRWNLTLDHIIPVSKGGGWHLNNLQCLCYDCNQAKGRKMPYELAA